MSINHTGGDLSRFRNSSKALKHPLMRNRPVVPSRQKGMHRKNQQFHHAHARRSLISRGNAGSSTSHHQVDFVRPRSQYEGKGDDEDVEEIINDSDHEERAHLHFLETGKPLGCASPPPKHDSNPFTQLEKERDRFSLPPPEHTEYDPYDGTAVSNRYTSTSSKRIAPASFYNKLDLKRPRFEYDPYNLATTPPRRYGQQYGARDDSDLTEPGSSPEPDRHSSARDGHSPHREYDHTSSTQHGWSDDEYYDSEDEYLKKAKEEEQKRRDRKYGFPGTDDEIESGGSDELVSGDEWDELFFDGPIPTTEQMERFKGRPLTDEEREKQDQLQKAKAEYEAQKDEEERAKEEEAYDEANGILPYQRRLYRVWKPIVKDNGFEDLVNVTPHVWAPFPTKQIGPWCMLKSQRDKLPRFLFLNFENKPDDEWEEPNIDEDDIRATAGLGWPPMKRKKKEGEPDEPEPEIDWTIPENAMFLQYQKKDKQQQSSTSSE